MINKLKRNNLSRIVVTYTAQWRMWGGNGDWWNVSPFTPFSFYYFVIGDFLFLFSSPVHIVERIASLSAEVYAVCPGHARRLRVVLKILWSSVFFPCVRHSWPSFTFFLTFFCGYSLCLSRPTDPILVLWSYHRYRGHVIYGRRLVFVCRVCASVLSATENHGFAFRHR